jgi:hypothetical protein
MAVLLFAMAGGTYFRGFIPQDLLKIEPAVSIAVTKVAAYGASSSLPHVPAKVASPSDLPTFVIMQTDR